jgi:hypothetical protein
MKHTRCIICTHPKRHDLESELADGARLRPLARRYEISYDALWRHWRRHVPQEHKDRLKFGDAPVHKLKGMVAEAEISVLKDLNFARKSLIEALNVAAAEDANARGTLTGRLHENARIRGQITGELSRSPLIQQNTINLVMNSPEFVRFQADLIRVLNRFPDAREAVIAEFDRLEAEQAAQPLPALEHESDDETDQAA